MGRFTRRPGPPRNAGWEVGACMPLAVLAVAAGVVAVVVDEAVLALVAAACGVALAVIGTLLHARRVRTEQSLLVARAHARNLRRQIDVLGGPAQDRSPAVDPTDEWEIDPVSGLIRSRHLPVLLNHAVAVARRKVQPVSVVYWELDGGRDLAPSARDQALTALGAVAWRTIRESDAVFRLDDATALGVLTETAQGGAVVVANRVRASLRTSPVGDSLTVSAGIACYPSHALDPMELVSQAGRALDQARSNGHARDHVAVASPGQEPDPA